MHHKQKLTLKRISMKPLSIFFFYSLLLIFVQINCSDFHNNDFPHSTIHRYPTRQTYKYEQMFLSGDINQMNEAIQNKVDHNCRDKYGNTALHLAAYRRAYNQLKPLVELGINPFLENNASLICEDILCKNHETGCIDITDDAYFKKVMQTNEMKIIKKNLIPKIKK